MILQNAKAETEAYAGETWSFLNSRVMMGRVYYYYNISLVQANPLMMLSLLFILSSLKGKESPSRELRRLPVSLLSLDSYDDECVL